VEAGANIRKAIALLRVAEVAALLLVLLKREAYSSLSSPIAPDLADQSN